jgi:ornithine decarboxylase
MNDIFTSEQLQHLSHQTPFFVFSKEALLTRYREFTTLFPGAEISYAVKADAEPDVLTTMRDAGASFEIASVYELRILKEFDIPANRIIYGTSVKPGSHIKECAEYGITRFAADSYSELEKIAANAPGARVYIRLLVNDTGSIYRFSEKFGTTHDQALPLLLRAKELGLAPYGLSFHVGSQAGNPQAWAHAIDSLQPIFVQLQEAGITLEALDIGGGYPCNYASSEDPIMLKDIAESMYQSYRKLPYQPTLILEPGRAMVADAAILVATVIARVDRSEQTWLFLDAGVYNGLFEGLAYQGSIRYRVTSLRPSYDSGESVFALAGPTGDSWDVISREAHLPQDISVGDKLVFHSTGAYNLVMVGRFNGFPKPDVYFL